MACNRAAKSGFAAEAQRKINSKYSEELAQESLEWIRAITNEPINVSGDMDNFYETLKDGTLLCTLVNAIKPGSVSKINKSTMAFKCMENISSFLNIAANMGVPPHETFQTVDLWERQNLNSVVTCLQSLGRKLRLLVLPRIGIAPLYLMQGLKVRFFHECFLLNEPKASEAIARVEKPHRNPCIAHKFGQPGIGPKEADKNVREFSEEQLKAGQSIISLQYGSNKGANQSGINFGNTRHM